MANATTIYDVRIRYITEDKASNTLAGITQQADRASNSAMGLKGALASIGTALAAVGGIAAGKKAFIDFNSEVQQSTIGIAAISNMFSPGQTFDSSMANAEGVFERYQKAAITSTATTKDFLGMHQMLAPALARTSATQKQLEDIVKGATVAAPIMLPGEGREMAAGMFARDVRSMLEGTVTNRDHAAQLMISAAGLDREAFNKKARANINFAMDFVQKAMNSPTLKAAAKAQETSFAGVSSTLEDTLQILAGKAGQPLFQAITAEISSWNAWLTKNDKLIKQISKEVGAGLVEGFKTVKHMAQFVIDHKTEIEAIAGIFIGLKLAGGAASGIGAIGSALDSLNNATWTTASGLTKLAGTAAGVAGALGALYIGASYLADMLERQHEEEIKRKGNLGDPVSLYKRYEKGGSVMTAAIGSEVASFLESHKLTDKMGHVDKNKVYSYAENAVLNEVFDQAGAKAFVGLALKAEPFMHLRQFGPEKPTAEQLAMRDQQLKKPANVNVTIQRIEVASDDPDRFMTGLVTAAERALNNPTQARAVMHRAF